MDTSAAPLRSVDVDDQHQIKTQHQEQTDKNGENGSQRKHFNDLIELLRSQHWEGAGRLVSEHPAVLAYRDLTTERYPAHWAASCGYLPIVEHSVASRPNLVELGDNSGWTLLMIAASAGHPEIVRYLLSKDNTDVNHRNANGQTPLHYASSKNHLAIVRLLVENGAELSIRDRYGATPLHRAAGRGHETILNYLVGRMKQCSGGAEMALDLLDAEGNSPLHLACEEGHGSVALFLVRSGANVHRQNRDEQTPMDLANDPELKRKLLQAYELRRTS